MNKLITVAALGMLCTTTAHGEPTHWYIGHMGADACVPLADIGSHMERMYYGTGAGFRTPEDLLRGMHDNMRVAATYALDAPHTTQHMRTYAITLIDGGKVNFSFFDDLDECKYVMSTLEK